MSSPTPPKGPPETKEIKTRVKSYDGKVYAEAIAVDGTVTSILETKEDVPSYVSNNFKKSERGQWCVHDINFSAALLHHLQSNMSFVNVDQDELTSHGFYQCCDHPSIPSHIYYEGYFHGLDTTSSPIASVNPRIGQKFDKPAAPLAFRAFIAAFKRLNNEIWIKEAVKGTFINKTNLSKNLFCDIAVQIHFGDAVTSKDIVWHKDNVNSILHLAVSMKGKRAVHYQVNEDMVLVGDDEKTNEEFKIKWQKEGNCYLSSPFAFLHAVEYPMCRFKDRVIAIQCRWLYDMNEYSAITDYRQEWRDAMNNITNVLSKVKVEMPSLEHVLQMEEQIKENQVIPTLTDEKGSFLRALL